MIRSPQSKKLRANRKLVERLAELGKLQCTPEEAAFSLGYDMGKMTKLLVDSPKASAAFTTGRGQGLEALRRTQLKLAETNATMAIFLGKTYLGQSDRREPEQIGAIDLSDAAQRVREKLAALVGVAPEVEASGDRGSV